jgi:hydrogenase nickel incorporation protein HypA/HybF
MHELAICQALLEQVESIARQHAARVSRVHVAVGPLSGVEPGLLERAYGLAAAGSAAEDSDLVIEEATVRVRCRSCGAESNATAQRLLCGECGNWQTELTGGDELLLLKVEFSKERLAVTAQS